MTDLESGLASVGVMAEGEYNFTTALREEMTVISGALNVLLPRETEWKAYGSGERFYVPEHSEFHLQVAVLLFTASIAILPNALTLGFAS